MLWRANKFDGMDILLDSYTAAALYSFFSLSRQPSLLTRVPLGFWRGSIRV